MRFPIFILKRKYPIFNQFHMGVNYALHDMTMAIFDEEAYATALSDYINRNKDYSLISLAFTDGKKLSDYLKTHRSVYLLINEKLKSEELLSEMNDERVILLSENRAEEKTGAWVYKYQSAKLILQEIRAFLFEYAERTGDGMEKFHTVFSPTDGRARNAYAEILVRDLSERESVLYLDMDPFPAGRADMSGMEKGMSEFIYYLKKGGRELKWKIKSAINREGASGRVRPSKCSLDLSELEKKDVEALLKVAEELGEYEKVVVNLGFYNAAAFEILKVSSSIDTVISGRAEDRAYADYFVEQMKQMKLKDAERRIQIVEFETDIGI